MLQLPGRDLESWRIITARVYCFARVSENLRVGLKYNMTANQNARFVQSVPNPTRIVVDSESTLYYTINYSNFFKAYGQAAEICYRYLPVVMLLVCSSSVWSQSGGLRILLYRVLKEYTYLYISIGTVIALLFGSNFATHATLEEYIYIYIQVLYIVILTRLVQMQIAIIIIIIFANTYIK